MHAAVLGDVVAIVAARRGIERQQPDRVDAELSDVVELLDQAGEIADAVVVAVEERFDVELVDDRVLVPQRIRGEWQRASFLRPRHCRSAWPHAPDREWYLGCKTPLLRLAAPDEARAGHQFFDVEHAVVGQAEFPQRRFELPLLLTMRIQ